MPLNEGHDGFAEELGQALRRTGDGFVTEDGRELVAGGLARGRRRLMRRRAAAVTGGVLAFAVVGVGGIYGGDLLGAGARTQGAVGAKDSSVATASRTALPTPERPGPAPTLRVRDLAAVLKANTPAGTWTIADEDSKGEHVSGVYQDGKGESAVSVGLYRAGGTEEGGAGQVECPDETFVPHDGCTSEKLPNGDRLMVIQGYEYPDRREETKNWRAVLLTRDGFLVDASEYNAPTEKGSAVTRANPPFGPAQLKTLVTAEGWRPLFKQLAVTTKPTTPGRDATRGGNTVPGADTTPGGDAMPPEPDGQAVRGTLRALLPKGLKVTSQGGEGEFAYVVVDDGKGKSLVQVNVQNGMGDVADQLFAGATKLPDGRLVKVTKEAGEKGGAGVVMWTADMILPSGFRVVVSAFNTGAQHQAATRAEPALTTDRLKAIVLDDRWLKFS
ncbi:MULTISPECIES: hypothetical protein [unclassified Streptomyces]|uniref:hypothetical protein n=1 Tax=Streptomyces sp. NPDC127129 TaxID=3345373 RepID=UPI00362A4EBD